MRLINVFSTATFFYCIATAWASQPDKVKLYGVSRNAAAAAASRTPQGHMKSLPAPIKTRTIKVKKDSDDPDRHLTQKGSIRGEQTDDHVQRKRSLEDAQYTCSTSEDLTYCCVGTVDDGIVCWVSDSPTDVFATVFFNCPPSIQLSECQSCAIVVVGEDDTIDPENDPQCQSCSICVDTVDVNGSVAYDCSNLPEGESVGAGDCSGSSTTPATPTPTPPSDGSSTTPPTPTPTPTPTPPSDGSSTTPPTLTPTPPSDGSSTAPPTPTPTEGRADETSSASLRTLSILSISATTIAAFGLF